MFYDLEKMYESAVELFRGEMELGAPDCFSKVDCMAAVMVSELLLCLSESESYSSLNLEVVCFQPKEEASSDRSNLRSNIGLKITQFICLISQSGDYFWA